MTDEQREKALEIEKRWREVINDMRGLAQTMQGQVKGRQVAVSITQAEVALAYFGYWVIGVDA